MILVLSDRNFFNSSRRSLPRVAIRSSQTRAAGGCMF
eukprot:COSAG02_NODE_56198_length_286_cov_1.385027_1_plen_36_part_10